MPVSNRWRHFYNRRLIKRESIIRGSSQCWSTIFIIATEKTKIRGDVLCRQCPVLGANPEKYGITTAKTGLRGAGEQKTLGSRFDKKRNTVSLF